MVGLKICVLTAGIKKYKPIVKKKRRKRQEKIVFLAKTKLNKTKVLISKDLTSSDNSHGEIISINNTLKEYKDT